MALAARCPHCHALFRVVADQLKLRGGLVRCGACRQVFDAIGSLSYVDDLAAAAPPPPAQIHVPSAPPAPLAPLQAPAPPQRSHALPSPPTIMVELPLDAPAGPARSLEPHFSAGAWRAPDAAEEAESGGQPAQPELPPEPAGADAFALSSGEAAGPSSQVQDIEPVTGPEAPPQEAPTGSEGAAFLLAGEPAQRRRWRRIATAACIPLALCAALQLILALRESVIESWPESRPLLVQACGWYGCSAGWPGRSDLLAVVGSELAAIPGTEAVELNASVRSRAPFTMALPAIEVTLTDTQNRAVARKIFLPADYLASSGEPSSRVDEGLAPNADLSIRLVFEARGLNAAGFVVYPFYL